MIIKFQDRDVWHVFDEVDSLEYRYLKYGEKVVCRDDALDYTSYPVEENEVPKLRIELWFMNKNQLELSQIFTYRPVYLLNNEGRTIDKI